jgi:hypothetical protein
VHLRLNVAEREDFAARVRLRRRGRRALAAGRYFLRLPVSCAEVALVLGGDVALLGGE